ncbi:sensor histidine kinase [Amnibacterium setariae]|uniref:histidine kinase n=1 Tax=Amnibacterium setariae TaxID=2306585 RepID=A0A3A1U0W7_9MICO|nr:sensor histidine kinase [Amnibacterium setariae]
MPLALLVSALLIAVVAVVRTRGDLVAGEGPLRGIAYGALGWAAVLAVGLLRRRSPRWTVVVAAVLAMAADLLQPVPPFALFPFGIALALAVVRDAWRWAIGTIGVAYLVSLTAVFVSDDPLTAARGFGSMVVLLVALGAGAFLRARRLQRQEEERVQAERQRTAIEEERLRIARELHDVLAHSLSSITVQAGVGLHLAQDRPAAAVEALETIRGASKEALDEVRGVLGQLRGAESAPLVPGPDLDALLPLVEEARRTGARVHLDDRLLPRPGRPVQLAVYRVVQEALTNARRHAPGAEVDIVLARDGDAALATVRDRLPGADPGTPVPGNGITGMRERAAALGGALDVRPHPDGLEVALRVPIPEVVA